MKAVVIFSKTHPTQMKAPGPTPAAEDTSTTHVATRSGAETPLKTAEARSKPVASALPDGVWRHRRPLPPLRLDYLGQLSRWKQQHTLAQTPTFHRLHSPLSPVSFNVLPALGTAFGSASDVLRGAWLAARSLPLGTQMYFATPPREPLKRQARGIVTGVSGHF